LVQEQIDSIVDERHRLLDELQKVELVTAFPSDSNFILFKTEKSANNIFTYLSKNGILVRNLSSHPKLNNCLRVTVGTKSENDRFLSKLKDFKA
jgi:histidinol-phosphate aminotransferase